MLQSHHYWTVAARELRAAGKVSNLESLRSYHSHGTVGDR